MWYIIAEEYNIGDAMRNITVCIILGMAFLASGVHAEQPEYTVLRTVGEITIDGILDEEDWKAK